MRECLNNMSTMICNRCEYKSKKDDILLSCPICGGELETKSWKLTAFKWFMLLGLIYFIISQFITYMPL